MLVKLVKRNFNSKQYNKLLNEVNELNKKINNLTFIVNDLHSSIKKHKIDITSLNLEVNYQNEKMTKGFIYINDEIGKTIRYLEGELRSEVDILNEQIKNLYKN